MRSLRCAAGMVALLAGSLCAGFAASAPEMTIEVDPAEITVGDLFTVTVNIASPQGVAIDPPPDDAVLGDAEVRSAQRSTETLPDGAQRLTLQYEATLWEVGESTVQAPPVTWRSRDGEAREIERPDALVTVRSVLPAGADDIRPLREPREIPLRAVHYALAALPLILLLGLIAGGFLWLRRGRRDAQSEETAAPPLPPAEEALAALDELESRDLVGQALLKEHYVELSRILRRYIERRWRLSALEETTGMLAESMSGSGRIDDEVCERITRVLRRADLAKFAKHSPEAEVARADVDEVRGIVRATRPREEVAQEESERALAS